MAYKVACNGGYKIYDKECGSIEEAKGHAKSMFRLHADSGEQGSGYIASQLPRIDDEINSIAESGTVNTLPGGGSGQTSWSVSNSSLSPRNTQSSEDARRTQPGTIEHAYYRKRRFLF